MVFTYIQGWQLLEGEGSFSDESLGSLLGYRDTILLGGLRAPQYILLRVEVWSPHSGFADMDKSGVTFWCIV